MDERVCLWLLLALICLPEILIYAAELGWIGSRTWRVLSVQYGAFWPGLLRDWQPNYAAQPWVMFLSYAVLHTGLMHMLGNALVTLWLTPPLLARFGLGRFGVLWLAAAICGAFGFFLLASDPTPMIGASGCVFGLVGAWTVLRFVLPGRLGAAFTIVIALIFLNVVTLIIEQGALAWQTHLAGFIAGAALAYLFRNHRRPRTV
ncbi:hypothetical protein RA29_20745 [Tateyamaria sp. ANG-S1]|nr:hypothetical protein RA29_20745 [Tateyamaria sp. ANG-S1]